MDLISVNNQLRSERPGALIVQSFDVRGRELVIAFTCRGGPREDEALVVQFHDAHLFHLPSVLHEPAFFRVARPEEARSLVPPASYDPEELSGKKRAFTVVILEDLSGCSFGYYVAAHSVEAS